MLDDDRPARRFDPLRTQHAVGAHPRQDDADHRGSMDFGRRLHCHINCWAHMVAPRPLVQHDLTIAFEAQVKVAGRHQHEPARQAIAVGGFLDRNRTDFVEPLRQQRCKTRRHVLHHDDRSGQAGGQFRQQLLQRWRPSGRGADDDDCVPSRKGWGWVRNLRSAGIGLGGRGVSRCALAATFIFSINSSITVVTWVLDSGLATTSIAPRVSAWMVV